MLESIAYHKAIHGKFDDTDPIHLLQLLIQSATMLGVVVMNESLTSPIMIFDYFGFGNTVVPTPGFLPQKRKCFKWNKSA